MAKVTFPEGFLWGAATASYQIEGSPLADGAGMSIWHRFAHTEGTIADRSTGDLACDHYNRWREDIQLMKQLGLKAYRFSIAWGRIFPEGTGALNEKGLGFYNRLVDALLEAGITPMITLYHWDLPGALQDKGGWANRDIVGWFTDYAVTCFSKLGDRVKLWITHNEPWVFSIIGYMWGHHAPGMRDKYAAMKSAHHALLSHGSAVQAFRQTGPKEGQIGITLNLSPAHPASQKEEDLLAARNQNAFSNGMFLDPLAGRGYPPELSQYLGEAIPSITPEEQSLIAQPIDFLGVNYYSRSIVQYDPDHPNKTRHLRNEQAQYTEMGWEVYPPGIYELLTWLHKTYPHIPQFYITENGAAFADQVNEKGEIEDNNRLEFLKQHFLQAHQALQEEVPLKGYMVWSLMDNFEWAFGYTKRFGIVYVDYPTQKRIIKKSGHWYSQVIAGNSVETEEE